MTKKMKILIVVSLMLNVLLVGALIGIEGKKIARFGQENNHFFKEMKEFRHAHKNERGMLKKERQRALEMLVYGPYEEMEYKVLIDKINIIQGKMFKETALKMSELMRDMTPEERQKLLKHLRKRFGYTHKK